MRKWATEVASRAKFASALPPDQAAANPGSLPVPCLIVNNKADLRGDIFFTILLGLSSLALEGVTSACDTAVLI